MRQKTILTLALIVFLTPFLGIPQSWKTTVLVIVALILAYSAYESQIKTFFTPKLNHDEEAANAFTKDANIQTPVQQ